MSATDRLSNERAFHDQQALERMAYFRSNPQALCVDTEEYLQHETWIASAIALLGHVDGLHVLDCGCGHGMASVVLARLGAYVTAVDLAGSYVAEALIRARINGVTGAVDFVQAALEALPFSDASFDRIWGNAVLHHLDLDCSARELARVLRPGGHAVFCEPWGGNWMLTLARRYAPYPGKDRSADESPLHSSDLRILGRHFRRVQVEPFQMLSMIRRIWPQSPLLPWLDKCDTALFRHWPKTRRWCRYVVVSLHK